MGIIFSSTGFADKAERRFLKVTASTVHSRCVLDAIVTPVQDPLLFLNECSRRCAALKSCLLFCVDAGMTTCTLLSTLVSRQFLGIEPSDNTVTFDTCYSSWADELNIIHDSMLVDSSPMLKERRSSYVVDGYACKSVVEEHRFTAQSGADNYLIVDFDSEVNVASLKIAHRPEEIFFKSVSVGLGLDKNDMKIVANVPQGDPDSITSVVLSTPTLARYLSLKQPTENYFEVWEVQVFPAD
ncbi:Galactose-binding domain-like [Trinorchestia longiramus]|nr:Galactose-binding domain-like [Trinorchestia longiramus]